MDSAADLPGPGGQGRRRVRGGIKRAVYEAKTIVARHPALALPIARRRHGVPVDKDTDIVIEGFPRSGTSFVVAAFGMAQASGVNVACHVHAPAQIVAAVRAGIPALLVIREPEETILSFVVRNPDIPVRQALRGWLRFYETLLPLRHGFVVGLFGDVTSDLGSVIRRVNERFGTSFAEFRHTADNVEACFREIDADYERRVSGLAFERSVARPSTVRDEIKAGLRSRYADERLADIRRRAERTYEAFASLDRAPRT